MKGGKDYTIFFQLIFITIQSIIQLSKQFKINLSQNYHAVLNNLDCTQEISDIHFTIACPFKSKNLKLPSLYYKEQINNIDYNMATLNN